MRGLLFRLWAERVGRYARFLPRLSKEKQPETYPIQPLPNPLRRERGNNQRDSPVCLRGRNGKKEPLPGPLRRERENNQRDTPLYLRVHNTAFERFSRLTLKLKSKQVTCSKLRIYGLTNRGIACDKLRIYELRDSGLRTKNCEFTNSQIGELQAINYEFTN